MNALLKPMQNGLSPLRVGRITGSRIAAVLGENPYSKPGDVLREMVREYVHEHHPEWGECECEFVGNEATQYGQEHEPDALAAYERERGVMTYGGGECVLHPLIDWIAVTPDGLVGDNGMIECKAPYRGKYTHIDDVAYYRPQVLLQLAVTGRDWCDFVVLDRGGAIHISRVERDDEWLPSVLPKLDAFYRELTEALAFKDAAAPFLGAVDRSDTAWRKAAAAYLGAAEAAKAAAEVEKAAREALLELAPSGGKGCGVNVIKSERAGSIAYAKAIKDLLPDADLSAYQGKPTTVFTVRISA
jgi:putative phage-type endonuclease